MPTDLVLPQGTTFDETKLGVRAEKLDYDGVWLSELWGSSSVVRLTDIAAHTDDIKIGTAIINVFSRTPAVLAMTAATLAEISNDRFRLGVGTSTRKSIEDLHGMAWDNPNPVRRAHEAIELTRAFLNADGRVEYDGEVFNVQDFPGLDVDVPIYYAALGQANCRVAARLCDGWIPHNVPFPDLEKKHAYISHIMETEGLDPSIDVAPFIPSAVCDNPQEAMNVIRKHLAYYIGNGQGYRNAIAKRFPNDTATVATTWQSGDPEAATKMVTDEMVNALGVAGTPKQARNQFRNVAAIDCVTRPIVTIPNNASDKIVERTIEELAPIN